jgi:hypothetical protein
MNTKNKTLVYFLVLLMITLQILPVSAQGENPPIVEVTISDRPSNEDANWPIIKTETHKRKDPLTDMDIVETIVVRKMPPTPKNIECESNSKKNKSKNIQSELESLLTSAATCVLYTTSTETRMSTSSIGGGTVTAYARNYADRYCNGAGECSFVKMKKLEIYWKRTSTSLGVINARTAWGCLGGGCWLCSTTGLSYYKYLSGTFNPTWGNLQTSTYTYTSTTMPIISVSTENGGFPSGGNDATATAPRSAVPLSVYAVFIFP